MAFAPNEVKGKLLKCIMAFANTRDGGHILIGVEQKGVRFEPTGATEQQARSRPDRHRELRTQLLLDSAARHKSRGHDRRRHAAACPSRRVR